MYKSLNEYIEKLEKQGELLRVAAKVDPLLEIAEITDRISKQPGGGKALLFENTGTQHPVLINMMGSERRMALALGVEQLDDIESRMGELVARVLSPMEGLGDKMKMLPLLADVSKWFPKKSRSKGECQQVIRLEEDAKLSQLPILKCWKHDGGRFITLPLVNTIDPDSGVRNVGMYRMQVTGERTTGMHWHLHKTGERHYEGYKRRGERMPISVCLGGDPVYTYAATAPMPDNMDEYLLAGYLRQKSVKLVKCITNDIYVPSDCDFVIEGYVDPSEEKFVEGPFGDHTGFYSLEDLYPEFHVTAITHRKKAVYPATIVGVPPQEDAYIAIATEKIFSTPIRVVMQPEMTDMYMPPAGVAHNIALLAIDVRYPAQAKKVATAMWGAGQMMFNKYMVIARTEDGVRDATKIAQMLKNALLREDIMRAEGVLDVLDHSAEQMGVGGKMMIDLTTPRAERRVVLPEQYSLTGGIEAVGDEFAQGWGALMLWADPRKDIDVERFLASNQIKGVNYFVVADSSTKELTGEELLWIVAQNSDAQRDIKFTEDGESILIDGRSKFPHREGYPKRMPNIVTADKQTIKLVDSRWGEYGIGKFIESPSLRYIPTLVGEGAQMSDDE